MKLDNTHKSMLILMCTGTDTEYSVWIFWLWLFVIHVNTAEETLRLHRLYIYKLQ